LTRRPAERLADVAQAIVCARVADALLQKAESTGDAELARVAYDAVCFQLFVIGEAVRALPPELLASEPEIPWAEIRGMRNVVGHEYHRIVPQVVRRTVAESLTPLQAAIERLLDRS
jgi:uncharacterized protein with HEPN domain